MNGFHLPARNPLLSSFIFGALLIIAIRGLFPGIAGAGIAVLVAVVIIILLGIFYHRKKIKDLARAGDDLYYLGLLFTLVSLCYALVFLFLLNSEGNLEQRTDALIGNFGIALISTIAGILARILLQDLDNQSAEAGGPTSLVSTAAFGDLGDLRSLRQALREATDAFNHFTRMTLDSAGQTARHGERLFDEFNETMNNSAKRSLEEAEASWREVVRETESQSERANSSINDLGSHLRTVGLRMREIEESAAKAQNGLTDYNAEIVETCEAFMQNAQKLHEETKSLHQSINEQTSNLTSFSERMFQKLNESMKDDTRRSLEEITAFWRKVVEEAKSENESANNSISALVTLLETAEQRLQTLGESTATAQTGLSDYTIEIVKAHETFSRETQKLHQETQRLHQSINEQTSDWTSLSKRLFEELHENMKRNTSQSSEDAAEAKAQGELANNSIGALADRLEAAEQRMQALSESVGKLQSGQDDYASEILKAHETFTRDVQKLHQGIEHLNQSISDPESKRPDWWPWKGN